MLATRTIFSQSQKESGPAKTKSEYYLQNKEAIKHQQKQYRLKNTTLIKEHQKLYYQQNKQAIQDRRRRYYLQNLEAVKEKRRLYQEENKLAIKEKKRLYWKGYKARVLERKRGGDGRAGRTSWRDVGSVRLFFECAGEVLNVKEPFDWYRVSRDQIAKAGGGALFKNFGNLGKALAFAYPEVHWEHSKFSFRGKKSGQRWLMVVLQHLLPENTLIQEDYLHPDLSWSTSQKTELDIWVPQYNLAIEYQGEQHYQDFHPAYGPNGTLSLYTQRDLKKKQLCADKGITLVTIPYWWDGKAESLGATLNHARPDVFPEKAGAMVVPACPPQRTKKESGQSSGHKQTTSMMHGQDWNGEQDLTGWYISEKLDGFRAFWDGSKLISKNGNPLSVPLEFTRCLPSDVCLDGELWSGYDGISRLLSLLRAPSHHNELHWKNVKFCVFDAPMHPGSYPERHSFASKSISGSGPHVCSIPIQRCLGLPHLKATLQEVTQKKGEGLMLYHPEAPHTPGRTSNLLKVKAYSEEDVKLLQCNPNSYSFLCEQKNGATCTVKCSGWDYMNPPAPGTILTVKHNGYFKTSQKLKYPFLLRFRPEITWQEIPNTQP